MLSFRSALKISISWCESMPNSTLSAPTSLAKPTLSAWNALSTYFAASATRIGTRKILVREVAVHLGDRIAARVVELADDGLLGAVEVGDAAALAQVLRVDGNAEVATRLESRAPLERGDDRLLGRAREHRAADHDRVPPLAARERRPRCPRRRARGRRGRSTPASPTACRRTPARRRSPGPPQPRPAVARSRPAAAASAIASGKPGSRTGASTVVDGRDLARVDVHSDDLMAAPREAARRNGAHVAQTDRR